jgi:PST family polysaccharide transporter
VSWFGSGRAGSNIVAQATALVISRGILLGSTVLVARVAGVAEYGSFALALIFFQAGVLLRDAGLGQALIVVGRDVPGATWSTFVLTSGIGAILAGLIALAADPLSTAVGIPAAAAPIRIMAVAFAIGSLGIASTAFLERHFRFKARAAVDVASFVGLGLATIIGLAIGLGATALALGYVVQAALATILVILLAPPWMDFGRGPTIVRQLVRFGLFVWASALLGYLATNLDTLTVAALGGAEALGGYALAYTIGTVVTISLAQVVSRVALPYYAGGRDNPAAIEGGLRTVLPMSMGLAVVVGAPIVGLAPEISSFLGAGAAIVVPLVVLAGYGIVRAIAIAAGTAVTGLGRPSRVTLAALLNVALLAVGLVPAYLAFGTAGVAGVVLVAMVISLAYILFELRRDRPVGLRWVVPPALAVGLLGGLSIVEPPAMLVARVVLAGAIAVAAAIWVLRLAREDGTTAVRADLDRAPRTAG